MSPLRVLLVGGIFLFAWLFVSGYPVLLLVILGGAVVLLSLLGFLSQPPSHVFSITVPPLERDQPQPLLFGTRVGQSFPEAVAFRIELRNLWALGTVTFLALAFALWAVNDLMRHGLQFEGWERPLLFFVYLLMFGAFPVVGAWLNERMLLTRGAIALARVQRKGNMLQYEFRDWEDGYRGGSSSIRPWTQAADTELTPVFMVAHMPDFNKPVFDFIFHRFSIIDRHRWPEDPPELEQPAIGEK